MGAGQSAGASGSGSALVNSTSSEPTRPPPRALTRPWLLRLYPRLTMPDPEPIPPTASLPDAPPPIPLADSDPSMNPALAPTSLDTTTNVQDGMEWYAQNYPQFQQFVDIRNAELEQWEINLARRQSELVRMRMEREEGRREQLRAAAWLRKRGLTISPGSSCGDTSPSPTPTKVLKRKSAGDGEEDRDSKRQRKDNGPRARDLTARLNGVMQKEGGKKMEKESQFENDESGDHKDGDHDSDDDEDGDDEDEDNVDVDDRDADDSDGFDDIEMADVIAVSMRSAREEDGDDEDEDNVDVDDRDADDSEGFDDIEMADVIAVSMRSAREEEEKRQRGNSS